VSRKTWHQTFVRIFAE